MSGSRRGHACCVRYISWRQPLIWWRAFRVEGAGYFFPLANDSANLRDWVDILEPHNIHVRIPDSPGIVDVSEYDGAPGKALKDRSRESHDPLLQLCPM
ncbi:MAG TPA: hypothetical protein VMM37_00685, partial [Bacteroidota bacterium]|nr:hypothetical protein [Bacteroidota bacterium]